MQFLDIALAENHSMLNFELQQGPHRQNQSAEGAGGLGIIRSNKAGETE